MLAVSQDNVLLVGPFPEGRPIEDAGTIGELSTCFKRCNIALVIAWPGIRTPYPSIARLLHGNGVPFSLVWCGRQDEFRALAAFFPLEDPSPCWRCLELRWLSWVPDRSNLLDWLEALQFPELFPNSVVTWPTEEERVRLSWLAMDVLGSDAGTAWILDEDDVVSRHPFLPHPQCAWCSPWAGVKPRRDRRVVSAAALIDERFGLLRWDHGRAEGHRPPTLGWPPLRPPAKELPTIDPVFLEAIRKSSVSVHSVQIARGWPGFHAGAETEWSRLSRVGVDGAISPQLLLDSVAAYAVSARAGRPLWRGTRRGVALVAPDPRDWIFPILGKSCGLRFDERLELDWARGHDLVSGDPRAIPADLVFGGVPRDGLECADVSGAVGHPVLEDAVLEALSRVAEDDALMSTWYLGLPPPRVPAELLPPPFADSIEEAGELGIELAVLDLTTDIGVPVVAIVGRTDLSWFYGCGACMTAPGALHRAWTHLGQCFVRRLPKADESVDFLFAGAAGELPTDVPGGNSHPVDSWRYLLGARGMRSLWVDITTPDVALAKITVAKAWIAGALPRPPADVPLDLGARHVTSSLGGKRLLALSVHRKLTDAPLRPKDLNAVPHPFV